MVKDPLTKWDGLFPYDALAPVGITPNSSMREVMDASFELMVQGLMTPEIRAAWDELRIKQKRLFVDFFLYQFDLDEEFNKAMEALNGRLAELTKVPDVSYLLRIDHKELSQMQQDFQEITMRDVEVRFIPEFEDGPKLPNIDFIQFDK
jgi:hypothetical protein